MSEIQYVKFAVNETPYCFWDLDVNGRNLNFINSIDSNYFDHIANIHGQFLEGDDRQYAATALRVAYSQGLESLFALLCALVQAPDCIIGWLLKYKNSELDEVIEKITQQKPIKTKWFNKKVTWDTIADLIFTYLKTGDGNKDLQIRQSFARLWKRFAKDYLDKNFDFEYKSIKHGNRAKMGKFTLAIGEENTPGVPAIPERMRVIGQNEFGSSFFVSEQLAKYNFAVRHQRLNWNPQNFIFGLQLISLSIANIVSYLQVLHGTSANEIKYSYPDDISVFQEPFSSTGMIVNWNAQITQSDIEPLNEAEILSVYNETEEVEDKENDTGKTKGNL